MRSIFFMAAALVLLSCSGGNETLSYAFPDQPKGSSQEVTSGDPSQELSCSEDPSDEPQPQDPSGDAPQGKRCFIWVDSYANMYELANSEDNIRRDLRKAADCGFTDIVVEVRSSSGGLFYKSDNGDPVKWLSAYRGSDYIKITRTATFEATSSA